MKLVAGMFFALVAFPAVAQILPHAWFPTPAPDRLVPPRHGLRDYEADMATVLKGVYAPNVRVRAILQPSFAPETAVGIRTRPGGYEIFALRPAAHIYDYSSLRDLRRGREVITKPDGTSANDEAIKRLESRLPPRPELLPVATCQIPIGNALAQRLIGNWRGMLLKVRFRDQPDNGFDGETSDFSMKMGLFTRKGQTWSPRKDSGPDLLVRTAYAMSRYCQTRDPADLGSLDGLSQQLQARLVGEVR